MWQSYKHFFGRATNTFSAERENQQHVLGGITYIGVKGDKGQIAKLMNKPVLLFDDREDNIERLRQRSSADAYLDGVVVRRGRKAHRRVNPGFVIENNCNEWVNIVRRFAENPDSFKRLPQRTH